MRLLSIAILTLLASCASIVSPGPDKATIATEPPGAAVYLNGVQVGTSPCFVDIPRTADSHELRFELEGYKTTTWEMRASMNGATILNALFGLIGIPMFVADLAGGNHRKFATTPKPIVLEPGVGVALWDPRAHKEEAEAAETRGGSVVWKNPPPKDSTD